VGCVISLAKRLVRHKLDTETIKGFQLLGRRTPAQSWVLKGQSMQQGAQQALNFVRRFADGFKSALYEAAPSPVRDLIDATPSLVLLLAAAFLALIVLQILLSVAFRRKPRRAGKPSPKAERGAQSGSALAAPPSPSAVGSEQPLARSARRGAELVATDRHDPRPGIESATRRGENGMMLGDLIAARASFEEAERTARAWARSEPGLESYRALTRTLLRLAETRQKAGDQAGAWRAAEEGVSTTRLLLSSRPDDPYILRELAVALERAGGVAASSGDKSAARRAWEEELQIAGRLAQSEGADPSWLRFLAVVHVLVGNLGESDAFNHFDRALRCFDQCAQAGGLSPTDAATRDQLRAALRRV